MKSNRMWTIAIVTAFVSALGGRAVSAQDKYTLKVPGGLAFSEFRGYEAWQVVSVSQDGPLFAAILADPVMIGASPPATDRESFRVPLSLRERGDEDVTRVDSWLT